MRRVSTGSTFLLADEAAAAEEARRAAVADARRRAETIADAPADGWARCAGSRRERLPHRDRGARPAWRWPPRPDAPTPVLPGRIEVTVTVTAEWELLPVGLV